VEQAQHQPEQGGFAGAVGSDQTSDTGWHLEIEILDGDHIAVVMDETLDFDNRQEMFPPVRDGDPESR
jgi:hypothetical protein